MKTIKELRALTGLSQVEFGKLLNIPRRSIENWEAGTSNPPEYVLELIGFRIENMKKGSAKMTVLELKNEIKKYNYVGIRGSNEEYEIGQVLETSYLWDYEHDMSSADTDKPIELGGTCALNASVDGWEFWDEDDKEERVEEAIELIKNMVEYNAETYQYENIYVIGSQTLATDYEAPDAHEMHMVDAVVIAKL